MSGRRRMWRGSCEPMTKDSETDSYWDYLINKKIPELPIIIKLDKPYLRRRIRIAIPFALVFLIAILVALNNFIKMKTITIYHSFDLLMTLISIIIFSAIILEIYRCVRLLGDTTWLEITYDGIEYRNGFFYTKNKLEWEHVKIFRVLRRSVLYLPLERHIVSNQYQVYFLLNKKFKKINKKNIRGAEHYDGYIKADLGFHITNVSKFTDNVDQKFAQIITENSRHPPLARFLNDVKKLCADHSDGAADVSRT